MGDHEERSGRCRQILLNFGTSHGWRLDVDLLEYVHPTHSSKHSPKERIYLEFYLEFRGLTPDGGDIDYMRHTDPIADWGFIRPDFNFYNTHTTF